MIPDFNKYFKKERFSTSSIDKGKAFATEMREYLEHRFKAEFQRQLAFQHWMASQDVLNGMMNKSFELAVNEIQDYAGKHIIQTELALQNLLFSTCRSFYFQRLFLLWSHNYNSKGVHEAGDDSDSISLTSNFDYRIKSEALKGLGKMENSCRNYFTWQYVDRFTLDQMMAITGKQAGEVKTVLYTCFKDIEQVCRQTLTLPVVKALSMDQYSSLYDYFNTLLPEDEVSAFIISVHAEKALQYYFQFFLALNEAYDDSAPEHSVKDDETLDAAGFISMVKKELENPGK